MGFSIGFNYCSAPRSVVFRHGVVLFAFEQFLFRMVTAGFCAPSWPCCFHLSRERGYPRLSVELSSRTDVSDSETRELL